MAVQHCIGRYGQTILHKGKLLRITSTSVWIELEQPYTRYSGNECTGYFKEGDAFFIPGVFEVDRQEAKTLIGFKKHQDFEHGHEAWLEQIDENGDPIGSAVSVSALSAPPSMRAADP